MNTANRIAVIDRCKKSGDWEGIAAFLRDGDKGMRRRAARALGEIGDIRAMPVLMEATSDPDAWVRLDVVRSLGKLRAAAATDVLIAALEDENIDIRMETLHTLGCTKDKRAVGPLVKALSDPHQEIRGGAAEALGRIGWTPAGSREKVLFLMAKKDWSSLLEVEDLSFDTLYGILSSREEYLRVQAVETLGQTRDERLSWFLLPMMGDPSRTVRLGAMQAFAGLPGFNADETLQALGSVPGKTEVTR